MTRQSQGCPLSSGEEHLKGDMEVLKGRLTKHEKLNGLLKTFRLSHEEKEGPLETLAEIF